MALRWVLFDLNGTLLDPSGVGAPAELGAQESLACLDEAVLLAMAETLTGGYRPFDGFLRAAIARRAQLAGDPTGVDAAMELAAEMPPYPDAGRAVDRLREAGLEVGVLTNSATGAAERSLGAAGLRDRMALVSGSDQVRAYKPHPDVYRHGAERTGVPPDEICMVAAHGWDLLGAGRAGMRTAWVARKERALPETHPEPDVRGATLEEAAEGIAAGGS
ncbi:MAG TPA: haloacid dehalogenase type II [Thermoleophilaceae bacterium]